MCTDPEATRGYDHNLDDYLMGYDLHFAVTPLIDNPSKCLLLTFFVTGANIHDFKAFPYLKPMLNKVLSFHTGKLFISTTPFLNFQ